MKDTAVIALKLALICAVAAAALSLMNMVTAPRIEAYREQRILEALQQVSGEYRIGEMQEADAQKIEFYYPLYDEEDRTAGYILRIRADGYGGPMQLIAGYLAEGSVITSRLLDNDETPGLGKEAERPSYMEKFEGKGSSDAPIPRRIHQLSSAHADAVSGSTITFVGIAEGLAAGSSFVQDLGGRDE